MLQVDRVWRSSFLGDADAMLLEFFLHPGLRYALNAPPYGRRRASLRPGCGSLIHRGAWPDR